MTTKETIAERARGYIDSKALILDTETTAAPWLNPNAEVCEIAIVNASGTLEFQSLIKTIYPIEEETSRLHGITNEMCANAPTWGEIHHIVAAILGDKPVLAYNAAFDSGVLARTAELAESDVSLIKAAHWGCLMEAWKSFHDLYKWDKLEVAIAKIGYTFEGRAHRAMADAKAARAILHYMANYRPAEQEQLIEMPTMLPLTDYEKGIV